MPVGRAGVRGDLVKLEKLSNGSNTKFNGGKRKALPQGWSEPLLQKPEGHKKVGGRQERVWQVHTGTWR